VAKFYTELTPALREFIAAQHIFFHASAPARGRINLSPTGLDTFRVLSDRRVAYLDLTGSECETAAHLAENGRLTLMFCSFHAKPLILRLYGRGSVVHPRDASWAELRHQFPSLPGARQIVVLDIESIMTTCGFAVPLYDYRGERDQLPEFTRNMGDERMDAYRRERNTTSIDGMPTYLFDDPPPADWGMHFLLYYEKAADHADREGTFQAAHREHVFAAVARGELVLGGPLTGPTDGAQALLFRAASAATVEAFAAADPYVVQRIVTRWQVRPWLTVVGAGAVAPLPG
jgi:uncharacterized protein YciI